MSNIISFDYGTKIIGVAVGETITGSSRPLDVIVRKNKHNDWRQLTAIIAEWQPETIVVGMPFAKNGGEQEMTRLTDKFINRLRARFNIPVYAVDERYTTFEAKSRVRNQSRNRPPKRKIDMTAANIILQSWLSEKIV